MKCLLLLAALLPAAGCATAPLGPPESLDAPEPHAIRITCDGITLDAVVDADTLVVDRPDGVRQVLRHVRTASGVKYEGAGMMVWMKGDAAMVEMDGNACNDCVITEPYSSQPWDDARARGAAFRAIGQEPGWTLEIIPGDRIVVVADYGERHVTVPDPGPATDGPRTVYHAVTGEHDVWVIITREPCRDIMSGERFDHSVTLTVDDQTWHGCGRYL